MYQRMDNDYITFEEYEEVVATVHNRTDLTDKIEALVMEYSGSDRIPAYTEDELKMLAFSDIECITMFR